MTRLAVLKVFYQGRLFKVCPFTDDQISVGAGEGLALRLNGLAPWHIVIERKWERYTVFDLGSETGTFVNGKRIAGETALSSGSYFQIGPYQIQFFIGEPPPDFPPPPPAVETAAAPPLASTPAPAPPVTQPHGGPHRGGPIPPSSKGVAPAGSPVAGPPRFGPPRFGPPRFGPPVAGPSSPPSTAFPQQQPQPPGGFPPQYPSPPGAPATPPSSGPPLQRQPFSPPQAHQQAPLPPAVPGPHRGGAPRNAPQRDAPPFGVTPGLPPQALDPRAVSSPGALPGGAPGPQPPVATAPGIPAGMAAPVSPPGSSPVPQAVPRAVPQQRPAYSPQEALKAPAEAPQAVAGLQRGAAAARFGPALSVPSGAEGGAAPGRAPAAGFQPTDPKRPQPAPLQHIQQQAAEPLPVKPPQSPLTAPSSRAQTPLPQAAPAPLAPQPLQAPPPQYPQAIPQAVPATSPQTPPAQELKTPVPDPQRQQQQAVAGAQTPAAPSQDLIGKEAAGAPEGKGVFGKKAKAVFGGFLAKKKAKKEAAAKDSLESRPQKQEAAGASFPSATPPPPRPAPDPADPAGSAGSAAAQELLPPQARASLAAAASGFARSPLPGAAAAVAGAVATGASQAAFAPSAVRTGKGYWKTFAPPEKIKNLDEYLDFSVGNFVEVLISWKDRILHSFHFSKKGLVRLGSGKDCEIPVSNLLGVKKYRLLNIDSGAKVFLDHGVKGALIQKAGENRRTVHPLTGSQSLILKPNEIIRLDFRNLMRAYIRLKNRPQAAVAAGLFNLSFSETAVLVFSFLTTGLLLLYAALQSPAFLNPEEEFLEKNIVQATVKFEKPKPRVADMKLSTKTQAQKRKAVIKVKKKKKASPKPVVLKKAKKQKIVKKAGIKKKSKSKPGKIAAVAKGRKPPTKKKVAVGSARPGGSLKTGKAGASAKTVAPDPTKTGLLGVFGGGGKLAKLDKGASGVPGGGLLGLAESATGFAGTKEGYEGQGVGTKTKELATGGKGSALVGIKGIKTKGRGGSLTGGRGTGGSLGSRGTVNINIGADDIEVEGEIDKAGIVRVIRRNRVKFDRCYQFSLQQKASLEGTLKMEWQILSNGSVRAARPVRDNVGSASLANCMKRVLSGLRFPPPPAGQIPRVQFKFGFSI